MYSLIDSKAFTKVALDKGVCLNVKETKEIIIHSQFLKKKSLPCVHSKSLILINSNHIVKQYCLFKCIKIGPAAWFYNLLHQHAYLFFIVMVLCFSLLTHVKTLIFNMTPTLIPRIWSVIYDGAQSTRRNVNTIIMLRLCLETLFFVL